MDNDKDKSGFEDHISTYDL
jgi:hypothetical protein